VSTSTIAVPVAHELLDTEINWELQPGEPASIEAPQDAADILTDAVIDALSYRLLACEALDRIRLLTLQLDRAQSQIAELRARLREHSQVKPVPRGNG
jgi:hypothetical protein